MGDYPTIPLAGYEEYPLEVMRQRLQCATFPTDRCRGTSLKRH